MWGWGARPASSLESTAGRGDTCDYTDVTMSLQHNYNYRLALLCANFSEARTFLEIQEWQRPSGSSPRKLKAASVEQPAQS